MDEVTAFYTSVYTVTDDTRNLTKQDVINVFNRYSLLPPSRQEKIDQVFSRRLGMVTLFGSRIEIVHPDDYECFKKFTPCIKAETKDLSYFICSLGGKYDTLFFKSDGICYGDMPLKYPNYWDISAINAEQIKSELERFWSRFGSDAAYSHLRHRR